MILSMTGYGTAALTHENKTIHVEVKSLNSKTLDLSVRLAPLFREKEMEIRQIVSTVVVRGKVDFSLWIESDQTASSAVLNTAQIQNYIDQIRHTAMACAVAEPSDWFSVLMRMPDVMTKPDVAVLEEAEWNAARAAIDQALTDLVAFRRQEGAALQQKFETNIAHITALLQSIEPYEKSRVEKIRNRILDGLKSIPEAQFDQNRLEQELIYYIEKLDISEEKQRLSNHLQYFLNTLSLEPGQGKKLGFIAQEMGREINTTGSKSNHAEMQNIVVKMKDELEQIKEQVLNVL